jgi:hypothetical protein
MEANRESAGKDPKRQQEETGRKAGAEGATPSESANNYSRGSQVSGVAADDQENWSRDHVEGEMTGQDEVLKASERIRNLEKDSNSRNTKMDESSPRGENIKPDPETP